MGGRRVRTDCDRMGISAPAERVVAIAGEGNTEPRRNSADARYLGADRPLEIVVHGKGQSQTHTIQLGFRWNPPYATGNRHCNKRTLAAKSDGRQSVGGGREDDGVKRSIASRAAACRVAAQRGLEIESFGRHLAGHCLVRCVARMRGVVSRSACRLEVGQSRPLFSRS